MNGERNQAGNIVWIKDKFWYGVYKRRYPTSNLQTTRKSGCLKGSLFMKLRTLLLAAIAFVVLAGSVVPANAATRHHHRHHHHHR